jgi:2-keto-3-deoxy-L-arabinonate dehydratase
MNPDPRETGIAARDRSLSGILPIVPTIFGDGGELDEAGQRATVDLLLRRGVHGLVVLANASEGYAVAEAERPSVITWVVEQAAGRVPIVVACNHPSTIIAVRYALEAQDLGASAVMFLPPFFGQWVSDLDGIARHCEAISRRTVVPLVLQDHPLSGISLPAAFLVDLARRVERLNYFKVEAPRAPAKIGRMRGLDAGAIRGIFGGTGGILFLEELDQGVAGTMPSSLLPGIFVRVLDLYRRGDRRGAAGLLAAYLPVINFETHLGGYRAAKELLALGGTIRSPMVRGPIRSDWDEVTMQTFRRMVADLDLAALTTS